MKLKNVTVDQYREQISEVIDTLRKNNPEPVRGVFDNKYTTQLRVYDSGNISNEHCPNHMVH